MQPCSGSNCQRLAWAHYGDAYIFLIAASFLRLRVAIGKRAFSGPAAATFDGNPNALVSLGISERELVAHEVGNGFVKKQPIAL